MVPLEHVKGNVLGQEAGEVMFRLSEQQGYLEEVTLKPKPGGSKEPTRGVEKSRGEGPGVCRGPGTGMSLIMV